MDFTRNVAELEGILNRLEDGSLPLEEAISLYEKGVKLIKECQEYLSQAERKVAIMDENGKLEEFVEEEG